MYKNVDTHAAHRHDATMKHQFLLTKNNHNFSS